MARDANAFFLGWGTPTPKKQNNLLNRISITRRWVTVYCPNPKFTKVPSARYLLIITKISIADYTNLLSIELRLYCTKQRKSLVKKVGFIFEKVLDFLSVLWYVVVLTGGTTHEKYDKRAMAWKHRSARG